ncbi:hypothetical protein [Pseudoduganella flava]|uniref:Uncharacterized protein n=1 Tax=Pseudoduganella flava TaxID=871742 RepID=A0ABX6FR16_9BURK|nr:hypothetical protein [Pseudoduganella flava]QGZ39941.1 hypothetical protein GO485_13345 [Pseudoduganella flava]
MMGMRAGKRGPKLTTRAAQQHAALGHLPAKQADFDAIKALLSKHHGECCSSEKFPKTGV